MNNNNSSTNQTTMPSTVNGGYNIFVSDEKKMEFKAALKEENRLDILNSLVNQAPKLELKVNPSPLKLKFKFLY